MIRGKDREALGLPPLHPFVEALEEYKDRFGGSAPDLWGVPADLHEEAARVMRAAIARGVPLDTGEVARALGLPSADAPPSAVL